MVNLAILNWDYVTSIVISFSIAASLMILYNMGRHPYSSKQNDKDVTTVAIISEYSRRLKHIEDIVVGLRIRIDSLELREDYNNLGLRKKSSDIDAKHHSHYISSHEMSQTQQANITSVPQQANITSVPQQEYASPISQQLTPVDTRTNLEDVQNGTMEYILKLLNERPRSSREIQLSIGRTREHTSRLMKRLYESHLVDRQSNSRPYKYTITHAGLVKINLPSEKDSNSADENASHHIIDLHSRQQRNSSEFQ
jgi:DNA-binding transcriptional ArsR family regulator